jgi:hypothetical protein
VTIVAVGASMLARRTPLPSYELPVYAFTGVAGRILLYLLFTCRRGWHGWACGYIAIL